jgi:hypothetical protein
MPDFKPVVLKDSVGREAAVIKSLEVFAGMVGYTQE